MRFLLGIVMVLVLLFVGAMGFGSINELESVETEGVIMLDAVMLEVPAEMTVAPESLIGSNFYDAQVMVAVAGSITGIDSRVIYSPAYLLDDGNTHLICATNLLNPNGSNEAYGWGDRNKYVLSSPFGGSNH